ncbi:MAG: thiamine-phosphate kinase [Bifidobacteriaceae bacterium]|jgi:thiamine-monophosphate kinase|nr:thiamine-phosphate kinase [Bifidobacteriaceae bacterium]
MVDESALIGGFASLLPVGAATELGPGDDSAVVGFPDGRVTVSTDMIVEGVHFRREWSSARDVGWRLAAQTLADAAAMGAWPTALVVALGGPGGVLTSEWTREFAAGLAALCGRWGTGVVGGDQTAAAVVVACGTVMGDLRGLSAVTRAGAQAGDVLALATGPGVAERLGGPTAPDTDQTPGVVGTAGMASVPGLARRLGLGGSAAGLAWLEAAGGPTARGSSGSVPAGLAEAAVRAYLTPDPPLGQGVAAARAGARALIDVSDGLMIDAGRIAGASGVRLRLDATCGPLAEAAGRLAPLAGALGLDVWGWVLGGGEDHALLAAFPPGAALPGGWEVIGAVEPAGPGGPGSLNVVVDGLPAGSAAADSGGWDPFAAASTGWDHFAAA